MFAAGTTRASTVSMRAWMSPIQAWKSLSTIFIRLRGCGEGLEHLAFQHLDLLLRRLQLLLAEAGKFEAALMCGERVFQRKLAAFHSGHDFFQFGERFLEGKVA